MLHTVFLICLYTNFNTYEVFSVHYDTVLLHLYALVSVTAKNTSKTQVKSFSSQLFQISN
jgi:hypothetical protein